MWLSGLMLQRHEAVKPGVGVLVLVSRRLPPRSVRHVLFQAPGDPVVHQVPEAAWDAALAAESTREVFAAIAAARAA